MSCGLRLNRNHGFEGITLCSVNINMGDGDELFTAVQEAVQLSSYVLVPIHRDSFDFF